MPSAHEKRKAMSLAALLVSPAARLVASRPAPELKPIFGNGEIIASLVRWLVEQARLPIGAILSGVSSIARDHLRIQVSVPWT
jgi:hypothetical protein